MKASSIALGAAVAGVVGLGLVAIPLGAGAAPSLPPVSAQDLISSVLTANPGAFAGTVEVDNALGLPALPGLPQLADGASTGRVWSSGDGRARLALPQGQDERTVVEDGSTLWMYDSAKRTVTRVPHPAGPPAGSRLADPTQAASAFIRAVQRSSTVSVDGTDEVAGRTAYDLVLTPKPTERTLLREVRVAIDAQRRMPLQLSVLANGSTDPVLRIRFTSLRFAGQDPALFRFTPPAGSTVHQPQRDAAASQPGVVPTVVGDGWDSVLLARLPTTAVPGDRSDGSHDPAQDPMALLRRIGTPVSGTWGSGWLVSTRVASAIVTSDGRVAAGAVPEQVIVEALAR